MKLRIRGPSGQSSVALDDTATVQTLKDTIQKETSLASFDVKYGYPPTNLALHQWPSSKLLTEIEVKLNGERKSRYVVLGIIALSGIPLTVATFMPSSEVCH